MFNKDKTRVSAEMMVMRVREEADFRAVKELKQTHLASCRGPEKSLWVREDLRIPGIILWLLAAIQS